jgi:hypothetical protein
MGNSNQPLSAEMIYSLHHYRFDTINMFLEMSISHQRVVADTTGTHLYASHQRAHTMGSSRIENSRSNIQIYCNLEHILAGTR